MHCRKVRHIYSSDNGFRIKSDKKLSEYNCNQDLVSSKTENQIGFSILNEVAGILNMVFRHIVY